MDSHDDARKKMFALKGHLLALEFLVLALCEALDASAAQAVAAAFDQTMELTNTAMLNSDVANELLREAFESDGARLLRAIRALRRP
jgi:hypothetical protein